MGRMMNTTPEQIKTWIETGLPGSEVVIEGDGRHFFAIVVNPQFQGHNLMARHRMVYQALGDKMQADIHALSLKAYTPDEYQNNN